MTSLAEHYARAFGPDRFFGLDMVINWIALVIIVWIIGLSNLAMALFNGGMVPLGIITNEA